MLARLGGPMRNVRGTRHSLPNRRKLTIIAQDPFAVPTQKKRNKDAAQHNRALLEDPRFHAQNVYAIIMRTLARFEFALGRRVGWSFLGHQLQVAPHAFADANAFYS